MIDVFFFYLSLSLTIRLSFAYVFIQVSSITYFTNDVFVPPFPVFPSISPTSRYPIVIPFYTSSLILSTLPKHASYLLPHVYFLKSFFISYLLCLYPGVN